MIISTILRIARGAANASLKTAKFVIDKSGKAVKTGVRAIQQKDMSKQEKKAVKKQEKRKDAGKNAVKKTVGTAVSVSRKVVSEGLILAVGIIEDIGVLIILVLVIVGLLLMMLIPIFGGVFTAAMSADITATSTGRRNTTVVSSGKKAAKITNPSTYDWYGNKDANLLKLTETSDKELYQIIMCNFELQKYGLETTSDNLYWNACCGIGLLLSEGGGGLYHSNMVLHTNSDEEKQKLINDKCNYVFAYVPPNKTVDDYGNGPTGLSWGFASDKSYDFGPFSIKNVNKAYLRDSIEKAAAHIEASGNTLKHQGLSYSVDVSKYSDNEAYAQWTLPGGLKFAYDCSRIYSYDDIVKSDENATIGTIFDRWGVEKTPEHLTSIAWADYYSKHHGEGDVDRAYILEYICALYQFADKDLNNISYVDGSGNLSMSCVYEGHGHMMEFLQTPVSQSSQANIQVVHDGQKKVYNYESGDTLAKDVLNWAKSKYPEGYKHLKEALDWAQVGAPEYRANNSGTNFSAFRSNLVACMGVYFSGQTIVHYMVEKLGIVFETEDGDIGSVTFSKAATKTQANLKDVILNHYVRGGVSCGDISEAFLADVEAYKKVNPNIPRDGEYIQSDNPWLKNLPWCAATVKGLMKETKLGDSDINLLVALRKHGSYPRNNDCADLGIGGIGRRKPNTSDASDTYTTSFAEGDSPYIRVHYTNKSAIRNANNGSMGNSDFRLEANSPQGVSYVSKGEVKVVEESLYQPKTGDVIIYSFDGFGWSHVGICYDYDKNSGIVTTVEGNTYANTSSGACGYTSHSLNYIENQSIAWIVEIDYVGLEKAEGVSTTAESVEDESGVYKIDDFVKNTVQTGLTDISKAKKVIDVSVTGTKCVVKTFARANSSGWDSAKIFKDNAASVTGVIGSGGLGSPTNNAHEGSGMTPYGTYYCRQGFGAGSKSSLKISMNTWYDISRGFHYWSGSSGNIDSHIGINKYYKGEDGYDLNSGGEGAELISGGIDSYYKYAMLIEYNYGNNAKKDGGSAFFLHVKSADTTGGCVAVNGAENMLKIAQWADNNTVIVIHNSTEKIDRQSAKQS